jgi:hypothetical protein
MKRSRLESNSRNTVSAKNGKIALTLDIAEAQALSTFISEASDTVLAMMGLEMAGNTISEREHDGLRRLVVSRGYALECQTRSLEKLVDRVDEALRKVQQ